MIKKILKENYIYIILIVLLIIGLSIIMNLSIQDSIVSFDHKFINFMNADPFNEKISQKIIKILDSCLQENIQNLVKNWISTSNISIEELFYSIILVDRTLISINEKLFLLFSKINYYLIMMILMLIKLKK